MTRRTAQAYKRAAPGAALLRAAPEALRAHCALEERGRVPGRGSARAVAAVRRPRGLRLRRRDPDARRVLHERLRLAVLGTEDVVLHARVAPEEAHVEGVRRAPLRPRELRVAIAHLEVLTDPLVALGALVGLADELRRLAQARLRRAALARAVRQHLVRRRPGRWRDWEAEREYAHQANAPHQ